MTSQDSKRPRRAGALAGEACIDPRRVSVGASSLRRVEEHGTSSTGVMDPQCETVDCPKTCAPLWKFIACAAAAIVVAMGAMGTIETRADAPSRGSDEALAPAPAPGGDHDLDAVSVVDPYPAVLAWLSRQHAEDWTRFELLDVHWTNGEPVAGAVIGRISGSATPTANGSLLLYAEVDRGAGSPLHLPLSVNVRPWVRVPVAARGLVRGQTLVGEDVHLEERPLLELRGAKASSGALRAGIARLRARGEVRAGEVLTTNLIEEAPLVASGDRVTIVLREGGIRLAAAGIARRAGRSGELIPVENVDSRRKVLASVIDERTVEVRQ